MKNRLFYGDCLDVLKKSIEDESIDLVYIDPPFNSKRNYNVLFESIDMTDVKAQKEAFTDTWSNVKYMDQLAEIQDLNLDLFKFLSTLDSINLSKGAVSYLTTMALRIHYMHRKLKSTGSFYLHCDPTMSHYLKIVCDLIFGGKNFRNEIAWHYRRWTAVSKRFQRMHDVIHFYVKHNPTFNVLYEPYGRWLEKDYKYVDEDGRRWRWHSPHGIKQKVYLDEPQRGVQMNDVWIIPFIGSTAKERLGFPTQKPEALLERIIKASSNEGDLVADFFCGCGTAVAVAQRLNRRWIGVDISHLAVRLIYNRVLNAYRRNPSKFRNVKSNIEIDGFPRDVASARELATSTRKGRMKFQDWVIEIKLDGVSKDLRRGYDGYVTIYRDAKKKDVVLIEVKSGAAEVEDIREFVNAVNNENAAMGVFVCFADKVTRQMLIEAQRAGYYDKDVFGTRFPRVQILTVEDLLDDKSFKHPNPQLFNITFTNLYS